MEIIKQDHQTIVVRLKGIPLEYANALRRVCLNGIPVFAIDEVVMIENSSALADEGLAHRFGMIPLKTDLSRFVEPEKCDCHSKTGCSNCRVLLMIDAGATDNMRTVTSAELTSEDEVVKPTSDKIPIMMLARGQKIKAEAYARLGRGTEHAKWNASNISVLTETDKEDEHILTVESTGSLEPAQIVLAGIDELANRLDDFKQVIHTL
ncbi:MAG: DNA-directed RNA polymerase subunit D [Nitrosopumilaceae archaeon]